MNIRILTPAERRTLRARAHHLQPVVMIGDAGLTTAVIREIDVNLKSHELIKIRVLGDDRRQRQQLLEEICGALEAAPVQHIGKILVVFRPRPQAAEKKKKAPARHKAGKPSRRTKRSYQND
ncbi:MAG: ribosome assembly RNA-binding protein YhbY [Burkholderiales bacterium]